MKYFSNQLKFYLDCFCRLTTKNKVRNSKVTVLISILVYIRVYLKYTENLCKKFKTNQIKKHFDFMYFFSDMLTISVYTQINYIVKSSIIKTYV